MELTKRKYIDGTVYTASSSSNTSNNYVIVYGWGVVKINLNEISEIEEYDSPFLYYKLKKSRDGSEDMDYTSLESFCCFAFGKKILLTEKHESLHESVWEKITYINLEKITMTNGNTYVTIV
jgi:hypothetical protein